MPRVVDSSRRSIADALARLDVIAANSTSLMSNRSGRFTLEGQEYYLPRYLFIGPKSGGDPIRIGLFGGIHGDEPEGVYALIRFLELLEREAELARGYCLFVILSAIRPGLRTEHATLGAAET